MRVRPSASEGSSFRSDLIGARAAGALIGDQADAVSARDLFVREVEHMAEQAADRRAKDMQDIQWGHCLPTAIGLRQSHRMRNPRAARGATVTRCESHERIRAG